MVATRRSFEGRLPLSSMTRLQGLLVDTEGDVRYAIEFDHDALRVPYVGLRIEAGLPLVCQRSLRRFVLPVTVEQRLGLVRSEGRKHWAEAAVKSEGGSTLATASGLFIEVKAR